MPHIFISYAKKDTRLLAESLYSALDSVPELTVWMDMSLEADESWAYRIQQEIDRADYVVVLLSPDVNRPITETQRRSFVLNEIDYAQQDNKPILPVMAQTTKMPVQIAGTQYIDVRKSPNNPTLVIERICRRFDILPSGEEADRKTKPTSLSLMPAPFAWVEIPKKGYSIAKYPITNAQFAMFKDDGGYHNKDWWLQSGWHEKELENWKAPRYWHDSKWNRDSLPVVGVSWFEAVAFSRWLSKTVGERIELPTEDQWQYAAQGDSNHPFPWGVVWNSERCNNSSMTPNWGQTTPVTKYDNIGNSPFGVVDMLGNVWEWCLDWNSNKKPLRGGCWRSNALKIERRIERRPIFGFNLWGFRLVRYLAS